MTASVFGSTIFAITHIYSPQAQIPAALITPAQNIAAQSAIMDIPASKFTASSSPILTPSINAMASNLAIAQNPSAMPPIADEDTGYGENIIYSRPDYQAETMAQTQAQHISAPIAMDNTDRLETEVYFTDTELAAMAKRAHLQQCLTQMQAENATITDGQDSAPAPDDTGDQDGDLICDEQAVLMAQHNLDAAAAQTDLVVLPADEETDGVIIVTADRSPIDPLEGVNMVMFDITQDLDKAFVEPVARGYEKYIPKPIRHGLANFIKNLFEPIAIFHYLVQLKPGKALETLGRFAINSTLGVAGIFDIAKREPFNIPHEYNGFANTFAYYGIGTGPYLFMPLTGPTTMRDMLGGILDGFMLPQVVGPPFTDPEFAGAVITLRALNRRLENDEQLRILNEADDVYIASREYYLDTRQAEIDVLKGYTVDIRNSSTDKDPSTVAPVSNGHSNITQDIIMGDDEQTVDAAMPEPSTDSQKIKASETTQMESCLESSC